MNNFLKKYAGLLDKPQKQLAPGIWYKTEQTSYPKMRPEVRALILKTLYDFIPKKDVRQAVVIGSITGFKYTETSDFDINVLVSNYKTEYHAIQREYNERPAYGTRHPVNYFIQEAKPGQSTDTWQDSFFGVYDLLSDQWIKVPPGPKVYRDPAEEFPLQIQIAQHVSNRFTNMVNELNKDRKSLQALKDKSLSEFSYPSLKGYALQKKQNELRDGIKELLDFAHSIESDRKFAYRWGWGVPRTSFRNLLYKFLENSEHGHLFHKLQDIKPKYFAKKAAVNLVAKKEKGKIIINENSFEYLLACLDNQKFINDVNADGIASGYKKTMRENQKAIDVFNRKCRKILHDKPK